MCGAMTRRLRSLVPAASALALLAVLTSACHSRFGRIHTRTERPATIEVEVYDRFNGQPLEGALVRVVRSYQEWSGLTLASPFNDEFFATDFTGYVGFGAYDLADYQVGFLLDGIGQAVIAPGVFEDEVIVTLEIRLPFEPAIRVDVPLDWDDPAVFVEIPY